MDTHRLGFLRMAEMIALSRRCSKTLTAPDRHILVGPSPHGGSPCLSK
jgi:hypothetical protein